MSHIKSAWFRPAIALLAVVAVSALWIAGTTGPAVAGNPGNVSISPANAQVGVGGTTTVDVNVTAPDGGLGVFIIEIGYDPDVVQVDVLNNNPNCQSLEVPNPAGPGNVVQANGCDAKDDPPTGGEDDTAVAFGAWIKNVDGTATGWTGTNTVARFTFRAVGSAGQSSPLTVSVCEDCFIRPNTSQATPNTVNGNIEIIAGTPQIWGNADCSADGIRSRDGQAIGKFVLQGTPLSQTEPPPCPDVGQAVTVNGAPQTWGNWDCSADGVRSRDGQATGKFVLQGTPLSQTEPPDCPDIGATVTVS